MACRRQESHRCRRHLQRPLTTIQVPMRFAFSRVARHEARALAPFPPTRALVLVLERNIDGSSIMMYNIYGIDTTHTHTKSSLSLFSLSYSFALCLFLISFQTISLKRKAACRKSIRTHHSLTYCLVQPRELYFLFVSFF